MILLGQTSRLQAGRVRWWEEVNVTLDRSWHQPQALLRQGYLTPPAPPLLASTCTQEGKKGEETTRLLWVLFAKQRPQNTMALRGV